MSEACESSGDRRQRRKFEKMEDNTVSEIYEVLDLISQGNTSSSKEAFKKLLALAADVKKSAVVRSVGFSSMTRDDAVRVFDVDAVILAHSLEDESTFIARLHHQAEQLGLRLDPVPQNCMDALMTQIHVARVATERPWGADFSSSEATIWHYVAPILQYLVFALKLTKKVKPGCNSKLCIGMEHPLRDSATDWAGPVEFVTVYHAIVMLVSEVKTDKLTDGLVQNMFQLATAYASNLRHGMSPHTPVFGCATTMFGFVFYLYDGLADRFVRSKLIALPDMITSTESLTPPTQNLAFTSALSSVCNILYSMLQLQLVRASPPSSPQLDPSSSSLPSSSSSSQEQQPRS